MRTRFFSISIYHNQLINQSIYALRKVCVCVRVNLSGFAHTLEGGREGGDQQQRFLS